MPCRAVLAAVLLFSPAWSAVALLRTFRSERDIGFQYLMSVGVLLVSTETALLGVDTASGSVPWTRADIPRITRADNPTRPFGAAAATPTRPQPRPGLL